jgi:thiol-disulfide isomerase/thioredoxin
MTASKSYMLIGVVVVIIGSIYFLDSGKSSRGMGSGDAAGIVLTASERTAAKEKLYEHAKEISSPDAFINTNGQPITIQEFIGKKVILVDFWTYSCINCQRTLPYLNDWHKKYADDGLLIVGLHTPEFEFEKNYDNVLAAVKKYDIQYPVVLDNDFSTWQAYGNRYWPRKYLIDIDGFIVYDHIGEGAYEETEAKIQELLEERQEILGITDTITEKIGGVAGTAASGVGSPEVYFGSARNEFLGAGTPGLSGKQTFTFPKDTAPNTLYLSGTWDITPEYALSVSQKTGVRFRYKAKEVYFVASAEKGVSVRILLDGKPVGNLAGEDVLADGTVLIKADGLYKIVQDTASKEHILELEILDPGLKAFTFTFG